MKPVVILALSAALVVVGGVASGNAATKGASKYAPGHQARCSGPGQSGCAPGHRKPAGQSAKKYTPHYYATHPSTTTRRR